MDTFQALGDDCSPSDWRLSTILDLFCPFGQEKFRKALKPYKEQLYDCKWLKGAMSQNAHDIFSLYWEIYWEQEKVNQNRPWNPATLRIKSSIIYVKFHVMVQK